MPFRFSPCQPCCSCSQCACKTLCGDFRVTNCDLLLTFNPPWVCSDGKTFSSLPLNWDSGPIGSNPSWSNCISRHGDPAVRFHAYCNNGCLTFDVTTGNSQTDCSGSGSTVSETFCPIPNAAMLPATFARGRYRLNVGNTMTIPEGAGFCVGVCVSMNTCRSTAGGFTATLSDQQGNQIGSLATDATTTTRECVMFQVPGPGTYNVHITSGGLSADFTRYYDGNTCVQSYLCCTDVQLRDGVGNPLAGGEVTITGEASGVAIASGTTGGTNGIFSTLLDRTQGPYTVTMSYGGKTAKAPLNSCGALGLSNMTVFVWSQVRVTGCLGDNRFISGVAEGALEGATIHYTDANGNDETDTTDAEGVAYFLLPYLNTLLSPSVAGWKYVISAPRFLTYDNSSPAYFNYGLQSHALQADMSSYECILNCNIPICNTLTCTDPKVGGVILTYATLPPALAALDPQARQGWGPFAGTWYGQATANYQPGCGCPGDSIILIFILNSGGASLNGVTPPSLQIAALSNSIDVPGCNLCGNAGCLKAATPNPNFGYSSLVGGVSPTIVDYLCGPFQAVFHSNVGHDGCIDPCFDGHPCGCYVWRRDIGVNPVKNGIMCSVYDTPFRDAQWTIAENC